MKRVLHLWQAAYPWEVRVGKINRALQTRGSEVLVLARAQKGEPARAVSEGVEIRRVGAGLPRPLSLPVPGNPLWIRETIKVAREFKADMILVRDIPLAGAAIAAGRKFGIPVVLDMAEHYPEAMRSWQKYAENPILRKLVHDWKVPDRVEAGAVSRMDGILVVCEEQKERLVKEYGYPAEKICVVLNTPELSAWEKFPKGQAPIAPFCFGYHGILCEDRELEVVLKGFDLAAAERSDIRLLLAGGGESEGKLRALAGTLAAKDRIRFTGRYSPDQLSGLYAEAHYGIVSLRKNIFTEHTLANKFFDYAALGKPFIYTDLSPLRRVMGRMRCGVGFEAGSPESARDAFLKILKSDYAAMSRAGMESVDKELNWAVDSKRLLDFLASLSA